LTRGRLAFGPPPDATFDVALTDDDVAAYRRDGFVAVDRLTTDDELEWLSRVVDEVLDGGSSFVFEPGRPLDEPGPRSLEQSLHPEVQYPELLQTTFARNARRIAAQLLDAAGLSAWGYVLRMPRRGRRAIPWHQDEAYWERELAYQATGAWLALDRTTMRFIAGSHAHGIAHHDPVGERTLLSAADVDERVAVTCELPPGGATFHHPRTLVSTPANRSRHDVRAYVLEVQTPPVRRDATADTHVYVADGRMARVP